MNLPDVIVPDVPLVRKESDPLRLCYLIALPVVVGTYLSALLNSSIAST